MANPNFVVFTVKHELIVHDALNRLFSLSLPVCPPARPPARYIAHLVGHEGPGSLLSLLKSKGWANYLSASPYHTATDWSMFMVAIQRVTEDGLVSRIRSPFAKLVAL